MLDIVRPTKQDCFRAQMDSLAVDELAARFHRSIPETEEALKAAGMAHSLKPRAIRTEVVAAARGINRAVILRELRAGRKPQELMAELKINAKHWAGVMYILGINPSAVDPDRLSVDLPKTVTPAPTPEPPAAPQPTPAPLPEQPAVTEPPSPAPEAPPAAAEVPPSPAPEAPPAAAEVPPAPPAETPAEPAPNVAKGKAGRHNPVTREQIVAALRDNPTKAKAAEALGISEATLYVQIRKHGLKASPTGEPAAAPGQSETPSPSEPAPAQTEAPPGATLFEVLDRALEDVIAGEPLPDDIRAYAYRLDEFIRGVAGRIPALNVQPAPAEDLAIEIKRVVRTVIADELRPVLNELTEAYRQIAVNLAGHRHQVQAGLYSEVPVGPDGNRIEVMRE